MCPLALATPEGIALQRAVFSFVRFCFPVLAKFFYQRILNSHQLFKRNVKSDCIQENSFQFTGKDYLQTHGTAMGKKMAV